MYIYIYNVYIHTCACLRRLRWLHPIYVHTIRECMQRVRVSRYTHIHVCIYTCVYIMYMNIQMIVLTYTYVYIYNAHKNTFVCPRRLRCVHPIYVYTICECIQRVCVSVDTRTYMYVCVCVYIYICNVRMRIDACPHIHIYIHI